MYYAVDKMVEIKIINKYMYRQYNQKNMPSSESL